eukprot:6856144-Alexandrium_andersonii.AAC.1
MEAHERAPVPFHASPEPDTAATPRNVAPTNVADKRARCARRRQMCPDPPKGASRLVPSFLTP